VHKAKIINFELLYLNADAYTDQELSEVNYDLVSAEISKAAQQECDTIFGLLLLDGFLYKRNDLFFDWMRAIEKFSKTQGIDKIILVPGMCEDFKKDLEQQGISAEIIFFDFTHRMVYNSYVDKTEYLHPWNNKSDQFLFLGGIPSRANRIRLLYKFYQAGLLSKCQWSFFKPFTDSDQQVCREIMKDLSDEEYFDFINICEQSIDDLYKDSQEYSRLNGQDLLRKEIYKKPWLKDPAWINPVVFKNSKFSVISEGNAYYPATSYKFLTEKTWRTVVNRHPFIIAGHPDQMLYAKERGLCTFENFLQIDFYSFEEESRFNSIVENVNYWLNNLNSEEVQSDVEKNYLRFFDIGKEQDLWFELLKQQYQVDQSEIDYWFNQLGFSHLVRIPNGN
jgi:hypothetical protein